MVFFLIIFCAAISIFLGRILFGRWFNHLSLYSAVWGFSLTMFETRLINYYPLEFETWLVIIIGWMAFLIGSITIAVARVSQGRLIAYKTLERTEHISESVLQSEQKYICNILWVINIFALLAAAQYWYIVISKFGSFFKVLLFANYLYSYRVSEGLPGSIPYLPSLALVGTLIAGVYTASVGRVRVVAIIPLIAVILLEVASMGRAKLIMASIMFTGGYFLYKGELAARFFSVKQSKFGRALGVILVLALLIASAEFVRSTRGANENLPSATSSLQKFAGASFITPSIYLYVSVHHGVLNQYLKTSNEKTPWGSNTFASVYRILSKLGFDTAVPTYQQSYKTPVGANTGSYLRELHADFGIFGVLIYPYLLGLVSSVFWYRFRARRKYVDLAVLVHLLILIAMSLFYMATRSGDLLLSLGISAWGGAFLDRRMQRQRVGA